VHRSYWINKNAIDCIKPRAKKFLVKLVTGTEIPVSTPYHAMVKDIARSRGLRERP
jgi:DNA-binding LytR/AlgR family response regulator